MQSNAIPDYVYFGEMIASKAVTKHTECLRECLATEGCKAVNYFEPLTFIKNVIDVIKLVHMYSRTLVN